MEKFFNCSGACIPEDHYMVDIRPQFQQLQRLIEEKRYFIVHAPRQTGKTTLVNEFVKHINAQGRYAAVYANVEAGQALRNQVSTVNKLCLSVLKQSARLDLAEEFRPSPSCFEIDSNEAIERLILRRDVHLDQLADKLTDPRVARIIEGILIGTETDEESQTPWEDKQYLLDLGLIRQGTHGDEIANPIYREIIPRELTAVRQDRLGQDPTWYVTETGKLDIHQVIDRYIEFYKEHSELITTRKTYTEAAHHLLFMSWLQRIVNGGGYIRREYAAGLGRLDLCIEFAGERFAFELKRNSRRVIEEGRNQLANYLHRLSLPSGWLIVFSRGEVTDWDQVGRREHFTEAGKQIEVIWL